MSNVTDYSARQTEYNQYLQSDHWQQVKLRYRQAHKYKCFVCPKKDGLHLHHRTYERLGAELDSDLVYLCAKCHGKVHRIARSRSKRDRLIDIGNGPEELKARKSTSKARKRERKGKRNARAKIRLAKGGK